MNELVVYRWCCPYCTDGDMGPAEGRCYHCHGVGLTNDVGGWNESELTPAPLPPGVMRRACVDCAFRSGSPELEANGAQLPVDAPFWCHHGMTTGYGGSYQAPGYYRPEGTKRDIPIGELVCAGWWALKTGRPLPAEEFREPGRRATDAPAPVRAGELLLDDPSASAAPVVHSAVSAQATAVADVDETPHDEEP